MGRVRSQRPRRVQRRGSKRTPFPFVLTPARITDSGGPPPWRGVLAVAFALALLVLMPALVRAQVDTVVVSWTAPGDDGQQGTATSYDLRVSEQPITVGNFQDALVVPQVPAPQSSGTNQRVIVRGLSRDRTYYFAVRTVDNQGNWSPLSNLVRWDWTIDTAPPSAPRNVRAEREGNAVRVRWDSNAEADLAGYHVYRRVNGGGPVRINSMLVVMSEFLDTDPPAEGLLSYQITAMDQRGNESAQSASGTTTLVTANGWEVRPGYPNPSRAGDLVHIPVVVPATASGSARMEILDAGGRPVRELSMSNPMPGLMDVVWDGRNDAGRLVAPGVYRGWLVVADVRIAVRLLRAP